VGFSATKLALSTTPFGLGLDDAQREHAAHGWSTELHLTRQRLARRAPRGQFSPWFQGERDMAKWTIQLGADELNALMKREFGGTATSVGPVKSVAPGRIGVVAKFDPSMLRPGGLVSGTVLMSIADTAAYNLILAHVGPELMAVTSSLTINFLRGAKPGDIRADADLLSLGRRLAVCDVRLWTESPDRLAAQATVTYARAASVAT
jgi:uncharacterized protein (TIGR00369 family)